MTETKAIYTELLNVQKGLANIPKNGKMKFGSTDYEYLKADDVQEKINPLLTENSIIVQPEYTVTNLMRGRGEGAPYVYVNLSLTYVSAIDGSALTVTAVGEAAATDDKSINKALTQAIKNAHRVTFQFASGEPEPDDIKPGAVDSVERKTPVQQKLERAANQETIHVRRIKGWVGEGGTTNPATGELVPISGPEVTAVAKRITKDSKTWKSDDALSKQVADELEKGVRV